MLALVSAALLAAASSAYAEGGTAAVAWGKNFHEQLASGFKSNFEKKPVTALGVSNVVAMAAGWEDSFALLGNGTVRAWGNGYRGQLGDNLESETKGTPTAVKNGELAELTHVAEIAVGGAHAMALLENGTVLTWGDSMDGTRGNGESGPISEAEHRHETEGTPYANRYVAATGPSLEHVTAIAAAGTTDYALLENGKVMAWGGDGNGKLGIGIEPGEAGLETCKLESSKTKREEEEAEGKEPEAGDVPCSKVPREVKLRLPEGVHVASIAGGYSAAYAVLSNGEVMAWGNGKLGELGTGKAESSDVPVAVDMANVPSCPAYSSVPHCPVVHVAAGFETVWALTEASEVIGWGMNGWGTLGSESTEECKKKPCSKLPKSVISTGTIGHVTEISVGKGKWGLALNEEGDVYALGMNEPWGQLGVGYGTLGEAEFTRVPVEIKGLAPVGGIAAGEQNNLAFVESGSGPPPVYTITPGVESLTVTWTATAPEVKLRWTIVYPEGVEEPKGKEKVANIKETCSPEKPCTYTIKGLNPEYVYSVRFTAHPEDDRYIAAEPLP